MTTLTTTNTTPTILIPTPTIETTDKFDFISQQVSIDDRDLEISRTYTLRQTSPTTQSLLPTPCTSSSSFSIPDIFTFTSSPSNDRGLTKKNRHPHIDIVRHRGGGESQIQSKQFATVHFEAHGATIAYEGRDQGRQLTDSGQGIYTCRAADDGGTETVHRWQPLGPSRSVLEMTNDMGKRVALFTYSEGVAPRRPSGFGFGGPLKFDREEVLGDVHILDNEIGIEVGSVLCEAVVVVELGKTKAKGGGLAV